MDSRLFKGVEGVGFKSVQTCYSLPRWYFLRGRSPAYPFFRKEKIHPHRRRRDCDAESSERALRRNLGAAQEVPRTQEGAFFFTKKAYCGNQAVCVAEGRKSLQTCPTPFFRP